MTWGFVAMLIVGALWNGPTAVEGDAAPVQPCRIGVTSPSLHLVFLVRDEPPS